MDSKLDQIKMIKTMQGKYTARFTTPMTKAEHILHASLSYQELADELLTIHKLKKPVWEKLYRSRIAISKKSRKVKLIAEPESKGASFRGAT